MSEFQKAGMMLAGILSGLELPSFCPMCEQPYVGDERIHRKCLLEKHGGTLPEGFDELIEAFELETTPVAERADANSTSE
jgi:hypothetical protein